MNDGLKKEWVQAEQSELSGMTAVVTGASQGIGRAIALELATAGADVLVHGHAHAAAAEEAAASIRSLGRQAQVTLCDLADPDQHVRLVEEAWRWHGQVDIWINNAGARVLTGPLATASFQEKMEQLWRVDVMATVALSRLAGQRMGQQGGVILNIGWDQAQQGMEGDSGQLFATIKGAVMAFTRSLAQSLAPHVRVNCLAPGWIQTEWGQQASASWHTRALGDSLLGRWGTAQDVARAARFLVGPWAAFVNGQVLAVNGGFRYGPRSPS